jgi:hypothetical protein
MSLDTQKSPDISGNGYYPFFHSGGKKKVRPACRDHQHRTAQAMEARIAGA